VAVSFEHAMHLVVQLILIISRAGERLLASQEIAVLHEITIETRAVNDKAVSAASFLTSFTLIFCTGRHER
jgi:hypothetical protein